MGGGSSVLSDELSKCLTQPSLEKFHAMQAECEAKQMSPLEMYVYLTARYEELLQAEREAVNMLANSVTDKEYASESPSATPSKEKKGSKHKKHSRAFIKDFPKLPPLTREASNLEEEFFTQEVCDQMEALQEDIEVHAIYDPYIESVVGKVFNVVDDPQLQSVVNLMLSSGNSQAASNNFVVGTSFVKQEAGGVMECSVCCMKFENRRALDLHFNHSPIHSVNMKIRQQIFQNTLLEAERLAHLAQQTISKLHVQESTNAPTAGPEVTAKARWKKAVNRVISNRLKQQFLPLLEQMCDTPAGVKLLYAGSKYFYKSKASFDIHIYLHNTADAIEIVPHFLPSSKKHKSRHTNIEPFPRMYLDYSVLVQLVLGMDMSESRLSTKNAVFNTVVPTSNSLVSAVTSKVVAMTTSKVNEADVGLNKTIEQALTSFILNHLKAVHDGKHHEYRLYFDIQGIQNNPLLEGPPLNLNPVPVSIEKIKAHYENNLPESSRKVMNVESTEIGRDSLPEVPALLVSQDVQELI